MKFLLGTDTCLGIMRENPGACSHFERLSPDDAVISAPTYVELYFLATYRQVHLELARTAKAFLASIPVLPFDVVAARVYSRLWGPFGYVDLSESDQVILSVAIANRLTLVTHCDKGFKNVPGLKVIDWMPSGPF